MSEKKVFKLETYAFFSIIICENSILFKTIIFVDIVIDLFQYGIVCVL
jgi:hypothetical protein